MVIEGQKGHEPDPRPAILRAQVERVWRETGGDKTAIKRRLGELQKAWGDVTQLREALLAKYYGQSNGQ